MRVERNVAKSAESTTKATKKTPGYPQTFVCVTDKKNDFFTVDIQKNSLVITSGRVGTKGQTQVIPCRSAEAADIIADAKILEKKQHGFVSDSRTGVHYSNVPHEGFPQTVFKTQGDRTEFVRVDLAKTSRTLFVTSGRLGGKDDVRVAEYHRQDDAVRLGHKKIAEKLAAGFERKSAAAAEKLLIKGANADYPVNRMGCCEVEAKIKAHYGQEYEIERSESFGGSDYLFFDVTGEVSRPRRGERNYIKEFKDSGEGFGLVEELLNDMAAAGAFPKGDLWIKRRR